MTSPLCLLSTPKHVALALTELSTTFVIISSGPMCKKKSVFLHVFWFVCACNSFVASQFCIQLPQISKKHYHQFCHATITSQHRTQASGRTLDSLPFPSPNNKMLTERSRYKAHRAQCSLIAQHPKPREVYELVNCFPAHRLCLPSPVDQGTHWRFSIDCIDFQPGHRNQSLSVCISLAWGDAATGWQMMPWVHAVLKSTAAEIWQFTAYFQGSLQHNYRTVLQHNYKTSKENLNLLDCLVLFFFSF